MTTKRYPETKSLSRSRKICPALPFPDHFAAAQPPATNGEHPVDLLIDAIPEVASRRRKLVRMAKRWQAEARNKPAFIAYEDARLDYFVLREQLYFNAGFERGLLAGRAESRHADAATHAFAHQLGLAVAASDMPSPRIAAALLEVAKAVVLGLPLR
ncbi:MAG: hypothetical protein JXP73_12720 [Deltaproteobacteria bacterium]|nr:hypothetical protein [Deltaproteobacteria bacterium]